MSLTLKKIYEFAMSQPWSIFDADIENIEDDDSGIVEAINTGLSHLWYSYTFSFRFKTKQIEISPGQNEYKIPLGQIDRIYYTDEQGQITELQRIPRSSDLHFLNQKPSKPTHYSLTATRLRIYPEVEEGKSYGLTIEHYTGVMCKDASGKSKVNLENLDDYVDIPADFEDAFKLAICTEAMVLAIGSETNRNYQSYKQRAHNAWLDLIQITDGGLNERKVVF